MRVAESFYFAITVRAPATLQWGRNMRVAERQIAAIKTAITTTFNGAAT